MSFDLRKQLQTYFEGSIELSNLDIKRATICRQDRPSIVNETRSPHVFQVYSDVAFSIHSVTHIDLPGAVGPEEEQAMLSDPNMKHVPSIPRDPEKIVETLEFYSKTQIFDSVVLDFSARAKEFNERYVNSVDGLIYQDIDENVFNNLIRSLEIDFEEDLLRLTTESEIRGKFVIIKTGWGEEFDTMSSNLANPYFFFRHPFLTHPFLNQRTAKWLVENCQIRGIGCDSPGIDNPMYYTRPHFLPAYTKSYYYSIFQKESPKFRPTSLFLLCNRLHYVKDLDNLRFLNGDKCFGTLCIIPVSFNLRDANLVKVFFKKEL